MFGIRKKNDEPSEETKVNRAAGACMALSIIIEYCIGQAKEIESEMKEYADKHGGIKEISSPKSIEEHMGHVIFHMKAARQSTHMEIVELAYKAIENYNKIYNGDERS